jgi:hypothetical protein
MIAGRERLRRAALPIQVSTRFFRMLGRFLSNRIWRMRDEDRVTAGIDALAGRRTMHWFTVNLLGTQSEEILSAASKLERRGDRQAATQHTARGWKAERAIPYELLRYPHGQRKFGLIFRRHVSRTNQEACWPVRCNYDTRDNRASWAQLDVPRIRCRPW